MRFRILALLLVSAGCAPQRVELILHPDTIATLARLSEKPDAVASRPARATAYRATATRSGPTEAQYISKNCPFGAPTLDPGWYGPTSQVVREGYVLLHSNVDKIPLWVCEGVSREQLSGNAERKDVFAPDPLLAQGQRAELSDYKYSGYDRGHQAPAGNQNSSQRLKNETFFLSNMAPQIGAFNQRVWRELEAQCRDWVEDRGFVFMITGPLFYDPEEDDPSTADGIIEYNIIGGGHVAVPTHFYKILVAKNSQDQWEAISFVLENRKYPKPYDFSDYIRSIDWIEEHSGIDFLPDLAVEQEAALEAQPADLW